MLRQRTALYLAVPALFLLVWDIYVATNDVPDDTISELLRDLSHNWLVLPFMFGVVVGHLFWNSHRENRFRLIWPPVIAVLLYDLFQLPHPQGLNILMLFAGIGVGAYFWPQKPKDPDAQ